MKRAGLVTAMCFLSLCWRHSVCGQGTLVFNNLGPYNGEVLVFNNGVGGAAAPLNRDLNFQLTVWAAGGLEPPVLDRIWLLSDGTATGINVAPGRFADPSHGVIEVPGIPAMTAINVQVNAWAGQYSTILEAQLAGAGFAYGSPFTMGTGSAEKPPESLVTMPPLYVYGVPEMRTWIFLGVGMVGLLLGYRRASHPGS
jgi:hypothetical protein